MSKNDCDCCGLIYRLCMGDYGYTEDECERLEIEYLSVIENKYCPMCGREITER